MDNGLNSGLVISDVSDHLAVFATFNDQLQRKKTEKRRYKRVRTVKAVNAFRNEL